MSHNHSHGEITSKDEIIALLEYMANHNGSHTAELSSLLDKMDFASDDARGKIASAIDCYTNGNDLLISALKEIKGE